MSDADNEGSDVGIVMGEDGDRRCEWAGATPTRMQEYHDNEWGRPVDGEAAHFERLTLEAFQSGLSWSTILTKRPAFREAFCDFDADRVAAFGSGDVVRLMQEPAIVRNRRKIEAAINNAQATVALREQGGLPDLISSFAPAPPTTAATEFVATSPESVALSKTLKKKGFTFVGPTTMYALMQAIGIFDPHLDGCFVQGSAVR